MKKLKILEVTHRFPPAIGGCEKVVSELSQEMVKQGHNVTVVTSTSLKDTDTRGISKGRGLLLKSETSNFREENHNGVKVLRFPPNFQFFTFAPNKEMKSFLQKNKDNYDIVHVHGYLSYEAYIVSKIFNQFVLTAHDVVSHNPGIFKVMKKIYDVLIGKKILKKSSRLIALTPANKEEYESVHPCSEKIKIIPNGINSYSNISEKEKKVLLESLDNPSHILLFIGRIVEYKGCGDIVKAMPEIIKKYPKSKAVFVGIDGGYTFSLKKMAKNLNVENNCVFTGAVDSIEPYLNIADVFVFPSRGEGFGLSPVEAMSMRIPSLMTDIGGLKYVLSWIGGYKLDSGSDIPSQISSKVDEILSDKSIAQKMKDISKKAKEYCWPGITDKTLSLFQDVISEDYKK